MPAAQAVFSNYYFLGPGPVFTGAPVTIVSSGSNTHNLVEADAVLDGVSVFGDSVTWDAFAPTTYSVIGFTDQGDPVISNGVGSYFLSNRSYNDSDMVPTSSSGSFIYCFARGSEISVPNGTTFVEKLKIGDLVETADGRFVSVKWVGRQTVMTRFNPAARRGLVRITSGALGDGLPHRDLTVTADHAMLLDGLLCSAAALINGSTITRVSMAEMGERFTVYHIETDAHDIILANGAATETYIDHASRRVFDNYAEYEALYGEEAEIVELPHPRVTSARQLPVGVRVRLAQGLRKAG